MELTALRYFIVVAKNESITKASEKLNITQSALSKVISKLEDEVGVPLFDRFHRRIQLNEAGKVFLVNAERAFSLVFEGVNAANGTYNRIGNNVICVAATFPSLLDYFTERYFTEHHGTRLHYFLYSYDHALNSLMTGGLDFFLTLEPEVKDARARWTFLLEEHMTVVVHKESAFINQPFNNLSDLKNVPLLISDSSLDHYRFIVSSCQSAGFHPNIVFMKNGISDLTGLFSEDFGIMLLPAGECRRLSDAGLPVRIMACPPGVLTRKIGVVEREDSDISEAARGFYTYLAAALIEFRNRNMEFVENL